MDDVRRAELHYLAMAEQYKTACENKDKCEQIFRDAVDDLLEELIKAHTSLFCEENNGGEFEENP